MSNTEGTKTFETLLCPGRPNPNYSVNVTSKDSRHDPVFNADDTAEIKMQAEFNDEDTAIIKMKKLMLMTATKKSA